MSSVVPLNTILKSVFKEISNKQFASLYLQEKCVGRGTQGQVYRAHSLSSNEWVAIKYFKKQFITSERIKYITTQIQLLSRLKSQNIISLLGAYQLIQSRDKSSKYFIIMDYCQYSLSQEHIIEKLTENKKCKIFYEIVNGIKYAHDFNVMHRDIKPQNILIKDEKTLKVKIADFGCSKENNDNSIQNTLFAGTPKYVDPFIKNGPYTLKSDVFSLGLIMMDIFCGANVFSECRTQEELKKRQQKFFKSPKITLEKFINQVEKQIKISSQTKSLIEQIVKMTLIQNQKKRTSSEQLLKFVEKIIIKNQQNQKKIQNKNQIILPKILQHQQQDVKQNQFAQFHQQKSTQNPHHMRLSLNLDLEKQQFNSKNVVLTLHQKYNQKGFPTEKSTEKSFKFNQSPSRSNKSSDTVIVKLTQTQKLAAVLIKQQGIIEKNKIENEKYKRLYQIIKKNKNLFKGILCLNQTNSSDFKNDSKQCITFLFHYLYIQILKDFQKFLKNQKQEKLFNHQSAINEKHIRNMQTIIMQQIQRIKKLFSQLISFLFKRLNFLQQNISKKFKKMIQDSMNFLSNDNCVESFKLSEIKQELQTYLNKRLQILIGKHRQNDIKIVEELIKIGRSLDEISLKSFSNKMIK